MRVLSCLLSLAFFVVGSALCSLLSSLFSLLSIQGECSKRYLEEVPWIFHGILTVAEEAGE